MFDSTITLNGLAYRLTVVDLVFCYQLVRS